MFLIRLGQRSRGRRARVDASCALGIRPSAGREPQHPLRDDDVRGSVARGLLGAGVAERGQIETSQQMLSRAEQHRGNRQVHLVDEPLLQILVAGITLTSFYAPNGWFGQYLVPDGIQGVSARSGSRSRSSSSGCRSSCGHCSR
jgi:hypothetical protein